MTATVAFNIFLNIDYNIFFLIWLIHKLKII